MSGLNNNMLGNKVIQNELHTTTLNIKRSFEYMMGVLIDQIKTSNTLNHAFDEFKLGNTSLVNGKLSPLLIPQHVMESNLKDIAALLQTKFNGFHLTLSAIPNVYSDCKYLSARNGTNIYVTIK